MDTTRETLRRMTAEPPASQGEPWPLLNSLGWQEHCRTLHLYSLIVGKTRLALEPMVNHWWQVPLYVTARGLTTGPLAQGDMSFDVELDLVGHRIAVRTSDGREAGFALDADGTLADFHDRYLDVLREVGVVVTLHPLAVEIPETIYLDRDLEPRRHDRDWASRFFHALGHADRLLKAFRGSFVGKASPVHFFWGSFDLAVSRFSGRRAPPHPGGVPHCPDRVMREAYSHEVSSAGFWPGGPGFAEPIFYSYAYPEPDGFQTASGLPPGARYDTTLREFVLPYQAVRTATSPDQVVRAFLDATYAAAAEHGHWDRAALER
jgi:hypothetical protein